jgi:hypothetical protein
MLGDSEPPLDYRLLIGPGHSDSLSIGKPYHEVVMQIVKNTIIVILCLLLIPVVAVATAGVKQKSADGPNRVFSGGPLVAGELHRGPDPDWGFVNEIPTIEMQLLDPAQSRRIWIAEYDNRIFIWSGYMDNFVGRLWKSWPGQAENDGRAVLRINGVRYERQLRRIESGDFLDGLTEVISGKYPSSMNRSSVEGGTVWLFEATPRES